LALLLLWRVAASEGESLCLWSRCHFLTSRRLRSRSSAAALCLSRTLSAQASQSLKRQATRAPAALSLARPTWPAALRGWQAFNPLAAALAPLRRLPAASAALPGCHCKNSSRSSSSSTPRWLCWGTAAKTPQEAAQAVRLQDLGHGAAWSTARVSPRQCYKTSWLESTREQARRAEGVRFCWRPWRRTWSEWLAKLQELALAGGPRAVPPLKSHAALADWPRRRWRRSQSAAIRPSTG
jgi:hypothetical protein